MKVLRVSDPRGILMDGEGFMVRDGDDSWFAWTSSGDWVGVTGPRASRVAAALQTRRGAPEEGEYTIPPGIDQFLAHTPTSGAAPSPPPSPGTPPPEMTPPEAPPPIEPDLTPLEAESYEAFRVRVLVPLGKDGDEAIVRRALEIAAEKGITLGPGWPTTGAETGTPMPSGEGGEDVGKGA